MLKKVIITLLSLCLLFIISITAAGETQQRTGRDAMPPMHENPSGNFAPPEGFAPSDGEFIPPQGEESGNAEATDPQTDTDITEEEQLVPENGEKSGQTQSGNSPFGGGIPEGMEGFPGNMQGAQNTDVQQTTGFLGFVKTYSTPITSVVLLGLAFIFVTFYKRKNY